MKADKKFILVDSNAIMHRAFHALPPLTTKSGEVVSVVYGFTSVLLRIVKDLKPDYIACAFDVAGGTFRDKIFEDYKGGRKKPDQEFYDQIESVKEIVRAMNIPIFEKVGFEADDVIGTLAAEISKEKNIEVFIATGDMDALQLVNKKVKVYAFKKGISETIIYNEEKVEERYGLRPDQIVDFKALRGDASDNIPGVKGIGEKTATSLLQEFGTLENLYDKIEKNKGIDPIKSKVLEKLIEGKKSALMSKELATIKLDVRIDFDLEKCRWGDYDREKLLEIFRRFEFFSLISRLEESEEHIKFANKTEGYGAVKEKVLCMVIKTEKDLDGLIGKIEKSQAFILKTLEAEHKIAEQNITGMIFVFDKKEIFFLAIACETAGTPTLFDDKKSQNDFLERLKPYLESEKYGKVGYNLKEDMESLASYGISLGGLEFDAMLAAYLLDPGKREYGQEKILFDNLGIDGSCELVSKTEVELNSSFGGFVYLFELREKLEKDLKVAEMEKLFYKIEMPLIPVLSEIEMTGVKIDTQLLARISVETDKEIERLSQKIHELSGDGDFNINSSRQLAEVLFSKMKISTQGIKKGKTGYSVAASELEKMRDTHPIIDFISQYRELAKLKNTYVDTLPKLINPKTKRLHTTFNQNVTATGRLSSSDPNLQNIPIRTEIGRRIRTAFVAEEGRIMLSADYSQIELRIIATIADDKIMQEIFNKGLDIHTATAAEVNGIPLEKVTSEMRRAAKALNFGVIYGMSVFGFAQSAGIDRNKAKEFIDNYMKRFSAVAEYLEKSKIEAIEKGYAETLWGRRRYLPELKSSNVMVRAAAERMAINMPIQGTAADLMKISMIRISEWAEKYNENNPDAVWTLLQVHDELLFSVKKDFLEEASKFIKHTMENGHIKFDGRDIDFAVPIIVSLKSGKNWGEMEK
jgi:DNA polymerase-1